MPGLTPSVCAAALSVLALASTGPGPASAASLPDFLRSSYDARAAAVSERLAPRFTGLCKAAGIPDTAVSTRATLFPFLFLHSLRRLPDSSWLAKLPPPPGFAKYRSWADVDRLPSLYLGDLATEQPRYFHRRCGELQTFGWCSEREMAFGVLLAAPGVKAKIKQEGIHVWTEAVFDLAGPAGKPKPVVVAFDNTFDTVEAWALKGSRSAWARDLGDGAQVGWYNQVAASAGELAKVRAIAVGPQASKRMSGQMDAWLAAGR